MASHQSSVGYGKFAGQDRRSNHYATPPTGEEHLCKLRKAMV